MNLISTIVSLSIMGVAGPQIAQMAITPMIAQKQALNFTAAESLAVTIAAQAEATGELPPISDSCSVSPPVDDVYQVTCTEGSGRYGAQVKRSFRIASSLNDGGTGTREFAHERPSRFSAYQCPVDDTWGVDRYNAQWAHQLGGACKPHDAWNKNAYLASNPDDWLFDINNINGWGQHPGY